MTGLMCKCCQPADAHAGLTEQTHLFMKSCSWTNLKYTSLGLAKSPMNEIL